MAITNLKRASADALAAALAAHLTSLGETALAANCKAIEADWEEQTSFPSLRVMIDDLRFTPASVDQELDDATAGELVVAVGDLHGSAEVRLGYASRAQRDQLEAQVLDAFLQDEDARAQVTVQLSSVVLPGGPTTFEPAVTFQLTEDGWVEEKVFDKRRYSSLYLEVVLPVLVRRSVVGEMDTLILAFTQDLDTDAADVATTKVSVADDGTLTSV